MPKNVRVLMVALLLGAVALVVIPVIRPKAGQTEGKSSRPKITLIQRAGGRQLS